MSEKFDGYDYCSAEDLFLLKLWPLAVALENIFKEDDPIAYETNAKTGERTPRRNAIRAMVNGDIASGNLTCVEADGTLFIEPIQMRHFSIRHKLEIKEKYDDYACLLYNPKQLYGEAFKKEKRITTRVSDEPKQPLPDRAEEQPDAATSPLILDSTHYAILKALDSNYITASSAILVKPRSKDLLPSTNSR